MRASRETWVVAHSLLRVWRCLPPPHRRLSPILSAVVGRQFRKKSDVSARSVYLSAKPFTPVDEAASRGQGRGIFDLTRVNGPSLAIWCVVSGQYVGSLALSNDLGQTLVATWIFSGYGLGQFGRWNQTQLAVLVLAFWSGQLPLSGYWVRRWGAGSVERVWRFRSRPPRPCPLPRLSASCIPQEGSRDGSTKSVTWVYCLSPSPAARAGLGSISRRLRPSNTRAPGLSVRRDRR